MPSTMSNGRCEARIWLTNFLGRTALFPDFAIDLALTVSMVKNCAKNISHQKIARRKFAHHTSAIISGAPDHGANHVAAPEMR